MSPSSRCWPIIPCVLTTTPDAVCLPFPQGKTQKKETPQHHLSCFIRASAVTHPGPSFSIRRWGGPVFSTTRSVFTMRCPMYEWLVGLSNVGEELQPFLFYKGETMMMHIHQYVHNASMSVCAPCAVSVYPLSTSQKARTHLFVPHNHFLSPHYFCVNVLCV